MGTLAEYIHDKPEYEAVAPMIVVRLITGAEVYLKGEGRKLPANADPAQLESLLERGLVRRIGASA